MNKDWKPFKFNILPRHRESAGVNGGRTGCITKKEKLNQIITRLKKKREIIK